MEGAYCWCVLSFALSRLCVQRALAREDFPIPTPPMFRNSFPSCGGSSQAGGTRSIAFTRAVRALSVKPEGGGGNKALAEDSTPRSLYGLPIWEAWGWSDMIPTTA